MKAKKDDMNYLEMIHLSDQSKNHQIHMTAAVILYVLNSYRSLSPFSWDLKVTADRKGDKSPMHGQTRTGRLQIIGLFDTKINILI